MTAIPLGRASLHGSVLPTRRLRGATSTPAYLVLLRAEIARFTRPPGLRPGSRGACAPPARTFRGTSPLQGDRHRRLRPGAGADRRLVSVALILTSRWTAVGCYAALRSPDQIGRAHV